MMILREGGEPAAAAPTSHADTAVAPLNFATTHSRAHRQVLWILHALLWRCSGLISFAILRWLLLLLF